MTSPLIEPAELARHLDDPSWIVVDCRFALTDPAAGPAAYARGHIRGARYANLDLDLARKPTAAEGRHPLPTREAFAACLARWGVERGSTVVAYDEGTGAIAARLWWLLGWIGHERRLVLDGGLAAWLEAGLPVDTRVPDVRPTTYAPSPTPGQEVVTTADLPAALARGALLIDARSAARYRGEQEPIDPVAGHVPGAVNRPTSENVEAGGRFRAPRELERELRALLGDRSPSDVIAMCGSGVSACQLLLAMSVAGLPGGKLYEGSWSEWIRDPARPVAKGASP